MTRSIARSFCDSWALVKLRTLHDAATWEI